MKPLFGLLLFLLLNIPALAAVSNTTTLKFEDHAFPEFITSARALAMGNAYLNKVDDAWAAFYNPAGLGTVRRPQFHLGNIHLEASNQLMGIVGDGPAFEIPGNFLKTFNPEEMRSFLVKDQGKISHARVNFFPNFTARGMTVGYLFSQRNRATIFDDVNNNFEVTERRDQGPVFALNASFLGGILKFGVTGVYLIRRELEKSFGPLDNISVSDADYRSGRGLQITGATRVTLPLTFLPTFSAVLRNATANDWEYTDSGNLGAPDEIKQTIDLGFSITPQVGKTVRLHLESNLKDATNKYDTDIKRRFALGSELDFSRRLFIRAGWGDGWGSAGLGVRSRKFIFDLTTYAVDSSRDGFRETEDRRWALSLSSGF